MLDEKKCRLVLKGVPIDTSEAEVMTLFKKSTGVSFVQKEKQKVKTCFVQFKSLEDSKKANFDNLTVNINGKKVKVEYCLPKDRYAVKKEEKIQSRFEKTLKKNDGKKNKEKRKGVHKTTIGENDSQPNTEALKQEKASEHIQVSDQDTKQSNKNKKAKLSFKISKDEKNRLSKERVFSKNNVVEAAIPVKRLNENSIKPKDSFSKSEKETETKLHQIKTKKFSPSETKHSQHDADKSIHFSSIKKHKKTQYDAQENGKTTLNTSLQRTHHTSPHKNEIKLLGEKYQKTLEERTFYLSNLSYKETKETIIEKMSKYGEIKSLKMETNDNKIFTGACIIEYEVFNKAIFTDEITSDGRFVEIKRKLIKNVVLSTTRLFISNIKKNLSREKIEAIFLSYKLKPSVVVKNGGPRKRNAGFCFLDFRTEENARKFLNLKDKLKVELGDFKVEKSKEKYNKN
ncbi:Heterogeneous nuclear ribonucleoprotein D0 [Cucumispora dikerogammari]|nr:Heterogeneous nuclear ribonucleoprotein D0 [Cucumispora dikerogammari]